MLSKPLLTTHEVADLLKVKEATVRAWIRAGELPAVQLHREWRVVEKHLEEFVASRLRTKAGSAPGPETRSTVDVGAIKVSERKLGKAR